MNEFKLIVAGGRDFVDYTRLEVELLALALGEYKDVAVSIVSGMAPGADSLAVDFAKKHGVELHPMPADWRKYGKAAGFRRNAEMAAFADGLLAFWDGASKGTKHMIDTMQKLGKPVHLCMYTLQRRSDEPQFLPQGRFTKVKVG